MKLWCCVSVRVTFQAQAVPSGLFVREGLALETVSTQLIKPI